MKDYFIQRKLFEESFILIQNVHIFAIYEICSVAKEENHCIQNLATLDKIE